MAVWMRLTHLFGLDRDEVPANLMHEALGPILRAAWGDIVEAPVPASMQTLLRQLNRPAQMAPNGRSCSVPPCIHSTNRKARLLILFPDKTALATAPGDNPAPFPGAFT
jgi:hypothetical protein